MYSFIFVNSSDMYVMFIISLQLCIFLFLDQVVVVPFYRVRFAVSNMLYCAEPWPTNKIVTNQLFYFPTLSLPKAPPFQICRKAKFILKNTTGSTALFEWSHIRGSFKSYSIAWRVQLWSETVNGSRSNKRNKLYWNLT